MIAATVSPGWVVHIAGPRLGPVQACSRCGQVLVDDSDAAWIGRSRDRSYGPGQPVVRLGAAGGAVITAPALPGRLPAGSLPCTTTPGETR